MSSLLLLMCMAIGKLLLLFSMILLFYLQIFTGKHHKRHSYWCMGHALSTAEQRPVVRLPIWRYNRDIPAVDIVPGGQVRNAPWPKRGCGCAPFQKMSGLLKCTFTIFGVDVFIVPDEKFLGKILTPVEINELENTPFEVLPLTLTNRGDSFFLSLNGL